MEFVKVADMASQTGQGTQADPRKRWVLLKALMGEYPGEK